MGFDRKLIPVGRFLLNGFRLVPLNFFVVFVQPGRFILHPRLELVDAAPHVSHQARELRSAEKKQEDDGHNQKFVAAGHPDSDWN